MATKTVANAKVLLKSLLGTTTGDGGKWGTELIDYLNDAQRAVVMGCDEQFLDATLVKRTSETTGAVTPLNYIHTYTMPTDMLRLIAVTTGDTQRVCERLPALTDLFRRANETNYASSGVNDYFYAQRGNKDLLIYPHKQSQTYYLDYVAIPTALTGDTSTFCVPDHIYEWVVFNAAALALLQISDPARAAAFLQMIQGRMASFEQVWKVKPPVPYIDVPDKR